MQTQQHGRLLLQMVFLVARQPALLELPPEEFKYSCQDLGSALNVPPAAAAYLISRLQPSSLKQVRNRMPAALSATQWLLQRRTAC